MKTRITLTIDPAMARRAKQLAHARRTSVSALVEEFVRAAPMDTRSGEAPFSRRWAGKFRVATSSKPDLRLDALKKRYGLDE